MDLFSTLPTRTIRDDTSNTTDSSATASCTTGVPDKYGHVSPDACNGYYIFYPSFEGNMAFAVLFGLTSIAHIVQAALYRRRFCWVVIMGALWETAAFILRTLGAHDQQSLVYVTGGTLLLLLAPLWINAFVYMTVARLIYYAHPEQKVWGIRATLMTKLFVWLDVFSFFVQVVGGILLSNQGDQNIISIGQKVYMAGIGVQFAFVVFFASMNVAFYLSIRREVRPDRNMKLAKVLVWITFVVLILIMIRIIFRLCEFGPGVSVNNPILESEDYTFVLDAFPMFMALLLLNCVHPGLVLRGPDSDLPHLSRKEKKELKRELKAAKRAAKEEKKAIKVGQQRHFLNENVGEHYDTESSDGASYHSSGPREEHRLRDVEMGTWETAYPGTDYRQPDGRGSYPHQYRGQDQV